MNLLFTTAWGAGYLLALIITMGFALTRKDVRYFAIVMIGLWVADRCAVNTLPPSVALSFLAYTYTLCGCGVVLFNRTGPWIIVAAALFITSGIFIVGSVGLVSWDIAGSVQEFTGIVAMLSIVWKGSDGLRSNVGLGFIGAIRNKFIGNNTASNKNSADK